MRSSGQNLISIKKSGRGHSAVLDYDEDVTKAAIEEIKSRNDSRPLFMTIGFYGPHCPYIAPKEIYDYYYSILPPMKYMENGHARWSFMNLLERLCIAPSFIKNRKHLRPFF